MGAAQASFDGTNTTQVNRFSSQVSGSVSFTASASVSVCGGVVGDAIADTFGTTMSLSPAATIGNEVTFDSAPGRTDRAEFGVWRPVTAGLDTKVVNGQVAVPAGGQLKVSTPRGCSVLVEVGASSVSGLAHAERVAFGDYDDGVVQEPVEQADSGGVLG